MALNLARRAYTTKREVRMSDTLEGHLSTLLDAASQFAERAYGLLDLMASDSADEWWYPLVHHEVMQAVGYATDADRQIRIQVGQVEMAERMADLFAGTLDRVRYLIAKHESGAVFEHENGEWVRLDSPSELRRLRQEEEQLVADIARYREMADRKG
jgi:hypothetical protein